MRKFIPVEEAAKEWMKNPKFRAEYDALEDEFALAEAFIHARADADMTQEQVAQAMGTTQAVVARLEGGRSRPSTRTLERFAKATGMRVRIAFERAPYAAIIDGQRGAYGVVIPDLPGCTAMGKTVDEALVNAAKAIATWTKIARADGASIPKPRSLDELRSDADARAAGGALVIVPLIRDAARSSAARKKIVRAKQFQNSIAANG